MQLPLVDKEIPGAGLYPPEMAPFYHSGHAEEMVFKDDQVVLEEQSVHLISFECQTDFTLACCSYVSYSLGFQMLSYRREHASVHAFNSCIND